MFMLTQLYFLYYLTQWHEGFLCWIFWCKHKSVAAVKEYLIFFSICFAILRYAHHISVYGTCVNKPFFSCQPCIVCVCERLPFFFFFWKMHSSLEYVWWMYFLCSNASCQHFCEQLHISQCNTFQWECVKMILLLSSFMYINITLQLLFPSYD